MENVRLQWGYPHLHSGLGIRRLAPNLFESRVGLQERLIFQQPCSLLYHQFEILNPHSEIV